MSISIPCAQTPDNLCSSLCFYEFDCFTFYMKVRLAIFDFFHLAHFTLYVSLQIHPCFYKWQDFLISLSLDIILLYMCYMSHSFLHHLSLDIYVVSTSDHCE